MSRTSRLRKVLRSYVPKNFLTDEIMRITSFDGTKWGEIERNTFDRVSYLKKKHTFRRILINPIFIQMQLAQLVFACVVGPC